MYSCICGLISNKNLGNHKRRCEVLKQKKEAILSDVDRVVQLYLDTYSVSQMLELYDGCVNRKELVALLKEQKVYEGLNGKNYLEKKVQNNIKIFREKYGVDNPGQIEGNGWNKANSIPYEKISIYDSDYTVWSDKVDLETQKTIRKINIPTKCEYTGIEFSDNKGPTNPNDPFKRTVDHKTPKVYAYILGWSPTETACKDNLAFVIRYANSIKSNTTYESFLPIAEKISEKYL